MECNVCGNTDGEVIEIEEWTPENSDRREFTWKCNKCGHEQLEVE